MEDTKDINTLLEDTFSEDRIRDSLNKVLDGDLSCNYSHLIKDLSEQDRKSISFETEKLLTKFIKDNKNAKETLDKFVDNKQTTHKALISFIHYDYNNIILNRGSIAIEFDLPFLDSASIDSAIKAIRQLINSNPTDKIYITGIHNCCECKYHKIPENISDDILIYFYAKDSNDKILLFHRIETVNSKTWTPSSIIELIKFIPEKYGNNTTYMGYCRLKYVFQNI